MPRNLKALGGPSRLALILQNLNKEPIPAFPSLKALRMTYAYRNDHWGARHFVKNDLPRVAYANPDLNIKVMKKPKKVKDVLAPTMELEFRSGRVERIDMDKKWSDVIFEELFKKAGGKGKLPPAQPPAAEKLTPLSIPKQTAKKPTVHSPIKQ